MIIYTDGSSKGNPGPGGFGVVICDDNGKYIDAHGEFCQDTTNNRMELTAILWTMKNCGMNAPTPIVYSDSAYAVQTYNLWMFNWEKNGWRKSDKKTPENLDIIQEYLDLYKRGYRINLKRIPGHAGLPGNELADAIATFDKKKIERILPQLL